MCLYCLYIYTYIHCIICLIPQGSLVHRRDTQRSPSSFVPVEDIASWKNVSATYEKETYQTSRLDKVGECWKKILEFGRFQNPSEMLQNTSNMLEKKGEGLPLCLRIPYVNHKEP